MDMRDAVESKEREVRRVKRENEKWRREVDMLKEEISIIGPYESENTTIARFKTSGNQSGVKQEQRRRKASREQNKY